MEDVMRHPPDEIYRSVRDTDPETLDSDELDGYLRSVAELRAWCDARQVRATRRQRSLAAEGRASEPRHGLSNHGRQSSKEAAAADDREKVCSAMPGFEDALDRGAVAAGHVDAIAAATKRLDDAERDEFVDEADSLLAGAESHSVDAFAKACRDLATSIRARHNSRTDVDELERQRAQSKVSRWVDKATGMHKTLIEADPLTDRKLWAAIQACRRKLQRRAGDAAGPRPSFDRLTVDALVDAVAGGPGGEAHIQLAVHVDLDTLVGGRHEHTLCETDSGVALPVETVRRMACEAEIIPFVLDGEGTVLDEGRGKRLATPEQRLALSAMQASCSHPDCTVTIDDCRVHHVRPWETGGHTDLAVLAPLCEPHHHLVHEGGWTLSLDSDRTATWVRPDGCVYWSGCINDRRPVAA
jgi:hypothetical protein